MPASRRSPNSVCAKPGIELPEPPKSLRSSVEAAQMENLPVIFEMAPAAV